MVQCGIPWWGGRGLLHILADPLGGGLAPPGGPYASPWLLHTLSPPQVFDFPPQLVDFLNQRHILLQLKPMNQSKNRSTHRSDSPQTISDIPHPTDPHPSIT